METSCTMLCLHRERLCDENHYNKSAATSFAAHPLSTIIMHGRLLYNACRTAVPYSKQEPVQRALWEHSHGDNK